MKSHSLGIINNILPSNVFVTLQVYCGNYTKRRVCNIYVTLKKHCDNVILLAGQVMI